MDAQKIGGWIVLWEVVEQDLNGDPARVALFKCSDQAVNYYFNNRGDGVSMVLSKPEWNEKTMD